MAIIAAWLGLLMAQALPQGAAAPPVDASVEIAVPSDRPLRSGERLAIRVRTGAGTSIERVVVLIGDTDWTDLFEWRDGWLEYAPGLVQLPAGRTPVVVYAVLPGNRWRELHSTTVNVATALGFDRAQVSPKVSVTSQGQAAETRAPDTDPPPRERFQDVSSVLGFQTEHARGSTSVLAHVNVLAVSSRPLAVRFAERAEKAPFVDLTDFAVRVRSPARELAAGQGSVAIDRYLLPALASRGFTYTERRSRLDLTIGAAGARSVVGFQQVLGVTDETNRVAYGRIGAEIQRRAGGARIEVAAVGGSRPAVAGFNEAAIGSVDRTRGYSTRFTGNWLQGRLRVDSGIATSTASSPDDPLVSRDFEIVPLADRTSRARHVEVGADLLRRVDRTSGQATSLSTSYRFERVDPFFRSAGSPLGAPGDLSEQAVDVTVGAGGITGQISRTWGHDNLEDVPSILTTDSELITARAGAPAGGWRAGKRRAWWPGLTYQLTMSSQAGRSLPPGGGFANVSQVPDQRNIQHTARADWQLGGLGFAYGLNRSFQDNRQEGRDTADFLVLAHQATVRLGSRVVDASFDVSRERSIAREFADVTRTTRVAGTFTWRVTGAHGVSALGNWTHGRGTTLGAQSASAVEAQYTYTLALGPPGTGRARLQVFGRSAWRWNESRSTFLLEPIERRSWSLNTGLSFSFS